MKTVAIIGAQWGDEGKGKITDMLSQSSEVVVRFQGGNNAGHTIIFDGKKIILHQIPSGILHDNCVSVIAHGVVFEPEAFISELSEVKTFKDVSAQNLKISNNASIITSYHKILDQCRENRTSQKIGTTGKGIGPTYEDKIARRGLKVKDLFDSQALNLKLKLILEEKQCLFSNHYDVSFPSVDEEVKRLQALSRELAPYVTDTFQYLDTCFKEKKKVLYEGAQGVLLDIDYGTYPYVTSSSTGVSGIISGAGLQTGSFIDERLGIAKAYTTRVGEGPLPTEIKTAIGDKIQKIGHEFGATTGRRRRCGWLDLVALKYAVKASCLNSLALTKLDVLSNLEELKVCIAYEVEGIQYDCAYPGLDLEKVTPIYKSFSPFKDSFERDEKDNLTYSTELSEYINFIESFIGVRIGITAFGPDREQIKFHKTYF